ncbi:MAG: hypothetical protein K2J67_07390 [Lachnospiraceae bacterium]|nr:hypothetical protein [Lachnospiraceae bacterium]
MYIANKYWDHYIGDTDDSLTLLEYLAGKGKRDISVGEIFADTGLDQLQWDFRQADSLSVTVDGMEMEIYYPIDLMMDLAALLLECKVNDSIKLGDLSGDGQDQQEICLSATPQEHGRINQALRDFVAEPLTYNLCEMTPEEDLLEMAALVEELRQELYWNRK